jgi:hypothetical protein
MLGAPCMRAVFDGEAQFRCFAGNERSEWWGLCLGVTASESGSERQIARYEDQRDHDANVITVNAISRWKSVRR